MKIGDRVQLIRDVGDYPMPPVPAGSTGAITAIADDGTIRVMMDQHFEFLDEWSNELEIYNWRDDPAVNALKVVS